jgi:hypothetical protein
MKELDELLDKRSGQAILNIGAGKEEPLDLPAKPYMLVNIDSGYYEEPISLSEIFGCHRRKEYLKEPSMPMSPSIPSYVEFMVKEDVFRFMEKYPLRFDRIVMYRFLEHVERSNVLYFIYLLATSVKIGGFIDCIVPNYEALAGRILKEDPYDINFEAEDIITTYELLNEPESPHCSVWTPARIRKFFQLEKRFSVLKIDPAFSFDGRDIYLRAVIGRF